MSRGRRVFIIFAYYSLGAGVAAAEEFEQDLSPQVREKLRKT